MRKTRLCTLKLDKEQEGLAIYPCQITQKYSSLLELLDTSRLGLSTLFLTQLLFVGTKPNKKDYTPPSPWWGKPITLFAGLIVVGGKT